MTFPTMVYHAAGRGDRFPPNSLGGLRDCLDAGARFVELDINPLADGEYALLHDRFLEEETDGRGSVAAATSENVRQLRFRWHDELTDERVATLSDAVELAADVQTLVELQLDLKAYTPVPDASLASLGRIVRPLGRRVRVSSTSDRELRRLQKLAPDLALGFDPLQHLDVDPGPGKRTSRYLSRTGDYGYLDDHALAADRWGTAAEYLAARTEALWAQAPVSMWYIRAILLARMLADGFDWIADLHRRGAQVTAWTLNPDHPHHLRLAAELIGHGVDRITTDDAPRWAEALREAVVFSV
jgi:glycerophosphoryl diester phosphodiesterase